MHPLVSIIIPTYNAENDITNCIHSVINQTYQNIEILVMDGGSTDHTLKIVNTINDTRLKLHSKKDKGIYDAMNNGIKKASGTFLYFMGADDTFYNTDVLRNIFTKRSILKYDFIYGNVKLTSNDNIYDGKFNLTKLKKVNICHQAIFYNKYIFEILGYYNLKWPVLADWDFNIKCFINNTFKKKHIDIIVANYNNTATSAGHFEKGFYKYKNDLIEKAQAKTFFLKKMSLRIKRLFKQ